jgi:hypothetical protein
VPGDRPVAPQFTAAMLDKKGVVDSPTRGKPVMLLFFLHTCPHCHEALGVPEESDGRTAGGQGRSWSGSSDGRSDAVRDTLKKDGLDFPGDLRRRRQDPGGTPAAGVPDS